MIRSAASSGTFDRLRIGLTPSRDLVRPEDAQVYARPHFRWLLLLAAIAILLQSTLLQSLNLRGAHLSLITVLLVWTGLRCGIVTGGWLGLVAGLIEDALGGGGTNVLGTSIVGFASGLISSQFFSDSLPIFVTSVAVATWIRGAVTYLVLEAGFGERGLFASLSHQLAWQTLLNCSFAVVALLVLRIFSHLRSGR